MNKMARVKIEINSPLSQTELTNRLGNAGRKQEDMQSLENYIKALKAGCDGATVEELVGTGTSGVLATGTLTASAITAQSVTVNGVTFTGGTDYVIALQTVTIIAAAVAALINASTDSRLLAVTATSALGVVTVSAKYPGAIGNVYTLAATGAMAASGANLSGGVDATRVIYSLNY
jgi:phage tail sheath gpL-like